MTTSRYTSNELTHFVGRGLSTAEERVDLLATILRTGALTHPPHDPRVSWNAKVTIGPDVRISENAVYSPGVVCFADIPLEGQAIHRQKYGGVGLAFPKPFLIQRGANPVFYIVRQSRARQALMGRKVNRATLFDQVVQDYQALWHMNESFRDLNNQPEVERIGNFLGYHVFGFMKFFDVELDPTDPDNYYMEREWRVIGPVRFSSADVRRVIFPSTCARRFREAMPDYLGQITFSDEPFA
jgi:hypothetical protein